MPSSKRKSKAKKPSKASNSATTSPSELVVSNTKPHTPNETTVPSNPQTSIKASPFTITTHLMDDRTPVFTIHPSPLWDSLERYGACEGVDLPNQTTSFTPPIPLLHASPPSQKTPSKPASPVTTPTGPQKILLHTSITLTRPSHPKIWTALVLEIRGSDPLHVYLRLYYYLRPSQLPQTLLNKHLSDREWGESELIASNEMEIVHADQVLGVVEVVHSHRRGGYPDEGGKLWWREGVDVVRGEWLQRQRPRDPRPEKSVLRTLL